MSKEAMKLALEALEAGDYYIDDLEAIVYAADDLGTHEDRAKMQAAITVLRLEIDALNMASKPALAEQPAQQEPRIDIYRSFEQWKSGNVLEHGVPRTEHYSEAQLDLVEMGWSYGYDAGRAVEQALDKKAENARELGLDYEPNNTTQMAREAGIRDCTCNGSFGCLERLVELVRADERNRTWTQEHWTEYEHSIRNATLDEIADKIGKMPFGDTAASFAVWIREQKHD
jgi:hypothetical protein